MSTETDLVTSEREAIRQYADRYSQRGYQVSVEPAPRELPEFLRTLAPDLIARRDGENIVVEIKTSSPASFEQVQRLARALENRAGWKLQVVYADLADPEWAPPSELPDIPELANRLASMGRVDGRATIVVYSFYCCGRSSRPRPATGCRRSKSRRPAGFPHRLC